MNRDLTDGVSSFHLDFHKNLSCPKLSCQESYYASKLSIYAFGYILENLDKVEFIFGQKV